MRPFIAFALQAFPQSGVRREALDSTLADWRYEAAAEATPLGRLTVAVRSTAGVFRAVLGLAFRDLVTEWRSPWLRRLALALALAFAALGTLGPLDAALRILPLFPFVVFVAEVTGRRDRPGVGLGGALVLAFFSVSLVSVVIPELREYRALLDWRLHGRALSPHDLYMPWQWERLMHAFQVAMHVVAGTALAAALREGPHRWRRLLIAVPLIVAPLTLPFLVLFYSVWLPDQVLYTLMAVLATLNIVPPVLLPVLTLSLAAVLRRVDQR